MPKNVYDIISVGPSGIDTIAMINEANVLCNIDKSACQLCLHYAEKILVNGMETKTAYNAMNNAVGSARLGLKTGFYTAIGGDANGERILAELKKNKVDKKYVQVEKKMRTDSSVVLSFEGERTILVYHENYKYKLPALASADWIYLTSMGKNWEPLYKKVAAHIKKTNTKLGFNPGSYQLKAGVEKLKPILNLTTVLFLNREEARLLTGIVKEQNDLELLTAMRGLGAKIAVMTDGPKGSYAFDGETAWFHETLEPTRVVERTGCGDSYATGFLAAMHYGKSVAEAMTWGTVNAAGVLQKIGPQDGLQTKEQILKVIKQRPKFGPQKI